MQTLAIWWWVASPSLRGKKSSSILAVFFSLLVPRRGRNKGADISSKYMHYMGYSIRVSNCHKHYAMPSRHPEV